MVGLHHEHYDIEYCELTIYFRGPGSLVLLDGIATVFAAPLKRNARYRFNHCGVPVVVASGRARLDIEGEFEAEENVLDSVVDDLHAVLDTARTLASHHVFQRQQAAAGSVCTDNDEERLHGPRVIVVGDQNTGKSSLCRALVNLGTRSKAHGIAFVDVDVGQQMISCPGSISAAFMETAVPVDEGFNIVMPLSFFFGDKIVTSATRKRYLDLCACAAQAAASVGFAKPQFASGGIIVNTMGWITDLGRDLLMELVSIFAATHIIVAGSDSDLENAMHNSALGRGVTVLRYPMCTRMPKRSSSILAGARTAQLVCYFSGSLRTPLSHVRSVCRLQDVVLLNALTLEPINWQDVKPCSLAAVSWSDSLEATGEANVAGYIILLEIGKRFISFLAPMAGELPKPFLLVSSTIFLPTSKIPPLTAN